MNRISFTKLSGAGNDFILFDRKIIGNYDLSGQFISSICKRGTGIGADGVLVISDSEGYAFIMKYYNADGSTGALCANGARCALKYGAATGRLDSGLVKFQANGIDYSGQIINERDVKFFLNEPSRLKYNFKVKAAGQLINASFADTGAPHLVVNIKDILMDPKNPRSFYYEIESVPVFELGRELRYSKDFAPEGTNVNFIKIENNGIKIRTYERGVENETLACGTGSVASALIAFNNFGLKPPVNLFTKSGEILTVGFSTANNKIKDLSLTGPADIVFNGELSI